MDFTLRFPDTATETFSGEATYVLLEGGALEVRDGTMYRLYSPMAWVVVEETVPETT